MLAQVPGGVEETVGLVSLVPPLGVESVWGTTLTRLGERSDNCVTHWTLSQFLSSRRTGGESVPVKEKGANRRQCCFPLQQQLCRLPVGWLEVYGRHVWWSWAREWAAFCRFIFCSRICEAVGVQLAWMLWWLGISGIYVQLVWSIASLAGQRPSFVVSLCPSCCHPAVKQKGTFSGFLALQMSEGEIHQELNVSRNSFWDSGNTLSKWWISCSNLQSVVNPYLSLMSLIFLFIYFFFSRGISLSVWGHAVLS